MAAKPAHLFRGHVMTTTTILIIIAIVLGPIALGYIAARLDGL